MTQEIKDLHFKHTLATGREIRLSIIRKAFTKPRFVADSVKDMDVLEVKEYVEWRNQIVKTAMDSFTTGEILHCMSHGIEVLKKEASK